jgi:hypothetical protein
MLAEDGKGFVKASGGPEVFDGVVEDETKAGGLAAGPAEELGGGVVAETSVVLPRPAGDGLDYHPSAGKATGLGGQFEPPTRGGLIGRR